MKVLRVHKPSNFCVDVTFDVALEVAERTPMPVYNVVCDKDGEIVLAQFKRTIDKEEFKDRLAFETEVAFQEGRKVKLKQLKETIKQTLLEEAPVKVKVAEIDVKDDYLDVKGLHKAFLAAVQVTGPFFTSLNPLWEAQRMPCDKIRLTTDDYDRLYQGNDNYFQVAASVGDNGASVRMFRGVFDYCLDSEGLLYVSGKDLVMDEAWGDIVTYLM